MEKRKLIYINLINGVSREKVANTFQCSDHEIDDLIQTIAIKIKSYLFARAEPLFPCECLRDARANRINVLRVVERINLDTPPLYPRITHPPLTSILSF